MSKEEYKEVIRTGQLQGSSFVPVFDSPEYVENKLRSMTKDRLKNYFRSIGVRSPDVIAFFDIACTDIIGPIPQKNGLREYKVAEGTKVNVYSSIRL